MEVSRSVAVGNVTILTNGQISTLGASDDSFAAVAADGLPRYETVLPI